MRQRSGPHANFPSLVECQTSRTVVFEHGVIIGVLIKLNTAIEPGNKPRVVIFKERKWVGENVGRYYHLRGIEYGI